MIMKKGFPKNKNQNNIFSYFFENFQQKTWVALVTVVNYMKSSEREISNPQKKCIHCFLFQKAKLIPPVDDDSFRFKGRDLPM